MATKTPGDNVTAGTTTAKAPVVAPEEKATAPTSTTVTSGKTVVYVGTADIRKILKGDWSRIEVNEQEAVTWDEKNKWTVAAADLTEAAVNYLNDAPDFVVRDAEV